MRRSRTWTAVVLGLALGGVVLTGCGSSGGSSTSSGSGGSVPAPAKEAAGSSAGADAGTSPGAPSATNAGGSKGGATTTPTAPDVANRSVIRTADTQIRTKDVTGSVRRAEDLATAAQGIVSGEKTYADPEQRARFQREAEAAARLQHANIVQVHEVGEWRAEGSHPPVPYLSLEFVDGGSLEEKVHGTPQLPRQAAELVLTLARAMHHAHQQGVIHRDLKPANVLLQSVDCGLQNEVGQSPICNLQSAIPKITDFGLAKQLHLDRGQT